MKNKQSMVLMPIIFASILLLTGCPRPQPPFQLINVSVDNPYANIGETVTLSWDYENPDLLQGQRFDRIKLLFQGVSQPIQQELSLNDRSASFEFTGPVTLYLEALSTSGNFSNIAVDVRFDNSFNLSATIETVEPNYPRLGYTKEASYSNNQGNEIWQNNLVFSQFAGIYDINGNGIIDALANNQSTASFLPAGQAFRGVSFSEFETDQGDFGLGFGFRQGSAFSPLDIDFLSDLPPAAVGDPNFVFGNQTDGIIFGGAMSYNGETVTLKTPEGEIEARTNITSNFEAIFMAIDIRSDNNGAPYIADLHLGNLTQGLIVSVYQGLVTPVLPQSIIGDYNNDYSFPDPNNSNTGIITGDIKGAFISEDKTKANGDLVFIGLAINTVDWQVPFYSDEELFLADTITFN